MNYLSQAHIMRNLTDIDENGMARSRGYGFVTFTEHEHALEALRKINNNPNIFTKEKVSKHMVFDAKVSIFHNFK